MSDRNRYAQRRDYMRRYQNEWIQRRRSEWIEANGPCAQCGSSDRLEVDHVDPSTKVANPAAVWGWSAARRSAELAKCQVLCHDCHERKSAAQFRAAGKPCPSRTAYDSGCRCTGCRAVHAAHVRDWRAKKRAQLAATRPAPTH